MEQSDAKRTNTTDEMTLAKSRYTEDEKDRIARFTERHNREPVKFKTVKSSSTKPILQIQEKDEKLGYAKLTEALGTPDSQLQNHLLTQVIQTFCGSTTSEGLVHDRLEESANTAMAFLNGIQPRDELEGLLACQMLAVHNFAMASLRRALMPDQTVDGAETNANMSAKMIRTFVQQIDALKKYRTSGQQRMVVEHVHVNKGGQAFVGTVTRGGGVHEKKRE